MEELLGDVTITIDPINDLLFEYQSDNIQEFTTTLRRCNPRNILNKIKDQMIKAKSKVKKRKANSTKIYLNQIFFIKKFQPGIDCHIPKKDYKKIEENLTRLMIPTSCDLFICKFDYEFLTKHVNRKSYITSERKKIENGNRVFLERGIGGNEDKKKAKVLFKQAADKNVSGAQLRYAFSLKENGLNEKNRTEFINYLTPAADNGNDQAQFNLGDIYLNGKLKFQINKVNGEKYLKLAAIKGNKAARTLCNKNHIFY
ncbi:42498_t:CDS:2 [Gigaspora margarita]|uniref:42498_t:CDS:1 n=1 Tax=Gigaspora margarita TaxID=4874 RepID=A0ABN7US86_GIGMA|nr:42498_t:CDS:2 [Gigaspora margarita]